MIFEVETEFGTLHVNAQDQNKAANYASKTYGIEHVLNVRPANPQELSEHNPTIIEIEG